MKKFKAILLACFLTICATTPVLADSPRIWSYEVSVTLPRWGGDVLPTNWVTKVSWDCQASFYFTQADQWLKPYAYAYPAGLEFPLTFGVKASEGKILYTDGFNTEIYRPYVKWYSWAKSNDLEPNETVLKYHFSPDILDRLPDSVSN